MPINEKNLELILLGAKVTRRPSDPSRPGIYWYTTRGSYNMSIFRDLADIDNPTTLGYNYNDYLEFRLAALGKGLLFEKWLRPQLGLPPVRSFPEDDAIIEGLATHLVDVILAIGVMKEEFRSNGLDSKRWFSGVDASVAKVSNFLQQFSEDERPPEVLPTTRFEREDVI